MTGLFDSEPEELVAPEPALVYAQTHIHLSITRCDFAVQRMKFDAFDMSAYHPVVDLLKDAIVRDRSVEAFRVKMPPPINCTAAGAPAKFTVDLTRPSKELLLELDSILCTSYYRFICIETSYEFFVEGDALGAVTAVFRERLATKEKPNIAYVIRKASVLAVRRRNASLLSATMLVTIRDFANYDADRRISKDLRLKALTAA